MGQPRPYQNVFVAWVAQAMSSVKVAPGKIDELLPLLLLIFIGAGRAPG